MKASNKVIAYLPVGVSPLLVGEHFVHYDAVLRPDASRIVSFKTHSPVRLRNALKEKQAVVMPPAHRPLNAAHVVPFAYAGVVVGDTGDDAALKLATYHRIPWLHPDAGDHDSAADLFDVQNPSTPAPDTSIPAS